tara:strand:- start:206 stop:319 length:114 start_codon:yes stop_codon:yes gene_type:complete
MEYLIIFLIGFAVGIFVEINYPHKTEIVIDFFNKWKK